MMGSTGVAAEPPLLPRQRIRARSQSAHQRTTGEPAATTSDVGVASVPHEPTLLFAGTPLFVVVGSHGPCGSNEQQHKQRAQSSSSRHAAACQHIFSFLYPFLFCQHIFFLSLVVLPLLLNR
jgi:hypothetical protein